MQTTLRPSFLLSPSPSFHSKKAFLNHAVNGGRTAGGGGKTELALILPHLNTDRQSRARERESARSRERRRMEEYVAAADKSEKGSEERLQGAQRGEVGESERRNLREMTAAHLVRGIQI